MKPPERVFGKQEVIRAAMLGNRLNRRTIAIALIDHDRVEHPHSTYIRSIQTTRGMATMGPGDINDPVARCFRFLQN